MCEEKKTLNKVIIPSKPIAFLFDWDNTLVESWQVIFLAFNRTLADFGKEPFTFDEVKSRGYNSSRNVFPEIFGDDWVAAQKLMYHYFDEYAGEVRLLEGARELIEWLYLNKYPMAIISNRQADVLRDEVERLGISHFFASVVGSGDTVRDKPDPALARLSLKRLGLVGSNQVWFVGDTPVDWQCAINSGCQPVGISEEHLDFEMPGLIRVAYCHELKKILSDF